MSEREKKILQILYDVSLEDCPSGPELNLLVTSCNLPPPDGDL